MQKYNDFEDLKDCIYEDACELVKDDIYDGILEDIKDYYYEGILEDAKDYVKYSDWSDVRSDAYSWCSDARSELRDRARCGAERGDNRALDFHPKE